MDRLCTARINGVITVPLVGTADDVGYRMKESIIAIPVLSITNQEFRRGERWTDEGN